MALAAAHRRSGRGGDGQNTRLFHDAVEPHVQPVVAVNPNQFKVITHSAKKTDPMMPGTWRYTWPRTCCRRRANVASRGHEGLTD